MIATYIGVAIGLVLALGAPSTFAAPAADAAHGAVHFANDLLTAALVELPGNTWLPGLVTAVTPACAVVGFAAVQRVGRGARKLVALLVPLAVIAGAHLSPTLELDVRVALLALAAGGLLAAAISGLVLAPLAALTAFAAVGVAQDVIEGANGLAGASGAIATSLAVPGWLSQALVLGLNGVLLLGAVAVLLRRR